MSHGKVICKGCNAVVAQCRCFQHEKDISYVDKCSNCPEKKLETTPTGKVIENVEHGDGRKAVTVNVNALHIENPDDGDVAAKKVIEEKILPELGNRVVLVTVIHKETLTKASVKTKMHKVRQVAETLIAGAPIEGAQPKDFIVVEVEGDDVRVSQL